MLLPHGYDGNGPEHSSSRSERYLQLCDEDSSLPNGGLDYSNKEQLEHVNLQVALPSTAANYFHLLRRQMRHPFRKPLVVVAPKKLLRFKGALSNIEDFSDGAMYNLVIND
jgi:2-oxoglutarate dehydrogenase E1 component